MFDATQDSQQLQQRSPALPQTTMSLDERLAAYTAKFDKGTSQSDAISDQPQVDPFLPQTSKTVDPEERKATLDKWLDPIAVDTSTPFRASRKEDYDHFNEAVMKDPAIKEIIPMLMGDEQNPGLAPYLRQMVQSGQMTIDDALTTAGSFMDEHFVPILDKHHGHQYDTTIPRTFFKARDLASELGITTDKIASGAKSPADLKTKSQIQGGM